MQKLRDETGKGGGPRIEEEEENRGMEEGVARRVPQGYMDARRRSKWIKSENLEKRTDW